MEATVSEIHGYPLHPADFVEPLFLTTSHRREIAEHLAASGWLWKASESRSGVVCEEEVVEIARHEGSVEVRRLLAKLHSPQCHRKSWMRRRVSGVVERWREVDHWWAMEGHLDRYVCRVSLEGGAVVDLSMDRTSREWRLIGVVD